MTVFTRLELHSEHDIISLVEPLHIIVLSPYE